MAKAFRVCALGLWLSACPALAQFCPGLSPWVFDDVASTHPFCTDITWMAQRGVTLGCTTLDPNHRLYCPNDSVTRGQMAAFMRRLGTSLFPVTCAAGQVMKWSGAAWACANDSGGTGWSLAGNAGTDPTSHFIGTTDAQTLVLRVNGGPALRIVPNPVSPNIIAGNASNRIAGAVRGGTIAGGGVAPGDSDPLFEFEAISNVSDHYGTIGGGYANRAGDSGENPNDSPFATVAGGAFNRAAAAYAAVAGGGANRATAVYAAVGGGENNEAAGDRAFIGGGDGNVASGASAVVAGGGFNVVEGDYAVVAGGRGNIAAGDYSFAAGFNAHALHARTFVWNGAPLITTASQGDYEFRVRTGTVVFQAGGASCTLLAASSGWACSSDRHLKSDVRAVDTFDVLERVARLPISTWSFTDAPGIAHLGPMAQDFHAAFALGDHPTHLSAMDVQGVALAAIQALHAKLDAKEQEIGDLRRALAAVVQRLDRLQQLP